MLYTLALGLEMLRDGYGFVRAHIPIREKIPKDSVLVDSHFHIGRKLLQTEADLVSLVHTFFDKGVALQAICDYGLYKPIGHVVP